jgi:TetR/AcrR family transcriptional repressor of nem operon
MAFEQSRQNWPRELEALKGQDWVRTFVSFYLSEMHRDAPGTGCPMPSLSPEIFRNSKGVRELFERHLQSQAEAIQNEFGDGPAARQRALAAIATCVGGLMLARVVTDSAFSSEILTACREEVIDSSAAEQPNER